MATPAESPDAEIVAAAIAEVSGHPAGGIAGGKRLSEDLGLDSLEFLKLIQIIEEMSLTRIPDDEAARATTVDELVGVLKSARLAQRGP